MIRLHGMSSPNVTKVVILLEELGLDYALEYVDVFRNRTGAIAGKSPFGKVPVIVDQDAGDLAVFESGAILVYLAETYGGEALLPASGPVRHRVLQWLFAQVATVGPLLGQNDHTRLLPDEAGSYAARRYAGQALRIYRTLDERLSEVPYLAGDDYSVADIATWPWAGYVPLHGLAWSDHPALERWWKRIAERPAVARATAATLSSFAPRDAEATASASAEELDRFFWREETGGGPLPDFAALGRGARSQEG